MSTVLDRMGATTRRDGDITIHLGPGEASFGDELLAVIGRLHEASAPELALAVGMMLTEEHRALCVLRESGGGILALVHGSATVTVRTERASLELAGCESVAIVDGFVAGRLVGLRVDLEAPPAIAEPVPVAVAAGPVAHAPAIAEPVPVALAAGPVAPAPAFPAPPPVVPGEVSGVRCRKGHFNDPSLAYCGICGLGLTQAGRLPALDQRPMLGVLVGDDGRLLPLDRDHVLGRDPDLAEEVRRGTATGVRLADPLLSDVHARIGLDGWDVTISDAGSAYGTYLREPDGTDWTLLSAARPQPMRPGTIIALGSRQFRFDSYRK